MENNVTQHYLIKTYTIIYFVYNGNVPSSVYFSLFLC